MFRKSELHEIGFNLTGTFDNGNIFRIELSDLGGATFNAPVEIGNVVGTDPATVFCSVPVGTPAGSYRLRVVSNAPEVFSTVSAAFNVTVNTADPNIWGINEWRVHVYRGNNFQDYFGYYVHKSTALTFDTQNRWDLNSNPSNAGNIATGAHAGSTAYVGCALPVADNNDNFSFVQRRQGFPCGYYQLDVTTFGNDTQIWIDGTKVFERSCTAGCGAVNCATTLCTGNLNNIWQGFLSNNSQMEIRTRAFTGWARVGLRFTLVNNLSKSQNLTVCAGGIAFMSASLPNTANFVWSLAGAPVSNTPSALASVYNPPILVAGVYNYQISAFNLLDECSISKFITVTVTPDITPFISANVTEYCPKIPFTLQGSGGGTNATYTWSPPTGLNLTTGKNVTATLTGGNMTYFLTVNDGCGNFITSISIPEKIITTDPTVFGAGEWRSYVYDSEGGASPFGSLRGVYTTNPYSFDSNNQWAQNLNPSLTAGYVGCRLASNDYFSISHKRAGFTCGLYRFLLGSHGTGDLTEFYVNGNRVSSTTGGSHTTPYMILGNGSQVDIRLNELTGNARTNVTVQREDILLFNTISNVCPATTNNFDAFNSAGSAPALIYEWTPTTYTVGATNTYRLQVNIPNPDLQQAYRLDITDPRTGCVLTNFMTVETEPFNVRIVPDFNTAICGGTAITLTGVGALNYRWYNNVTGAQVSTANPYVVTPPFTTSYQVVGFNGCLFATAFITIQVAEGNPNDWGNNVWNAYAYQQNSFTPINYRGYYVEPSLSIDTRTRWATNVSPSSATGYVPASCPVSNDNHALVQAAKVFLAVYIV